MKSTLSNSDGEYIGEKLSSLIVGDVIVGRISLGHELNSALKLEIDSCSYQADGITVNMIEAGSVNSHMKGLVELSTANHVNNECSFNMHVFTVGQATQAVITCAMKISQV